MSQTIITRTTLHRAGGPEDIMVEAHETGGRWSFKLDRVMPLTGLRLHVALDTLTRREQLCMVGAVLRLAMGSR